MIHTPGSKSNISVAAGCERAVSPYGELEYQRVSGVKIEVGEETENIRACPEFSLIIKDDSSTASRSVPLMEFSFARSFAFHRESRMPRCRG